jgi:8-oxo-dGTP pyrophosphatase MutT (NUDIX family)
MVPTRIRPITIGVFLNEDRLFVFEAYDPVKHETFYRPLGGGIEFGERSRDCLAREMREEMGAEITDLVYLGMIENIFTFNAQLGHEIVLVYQARFVDPHFYQVNVAQCEEVDAASPPFLGMWKPVSEFRAGRAPLYPTGLLELLDRTGALCDKS